MASRVVLLLMLAGLGVAGLGGCAGAGALASKLGPAPTEDAKFVPPKVRTLVLVENYNDPARLDVAAERLGRQISEDLAANKVVPVVAPEALVDLRESKGDGYRQMKIPAIGEALDARQVIYVHLVSYDADPTLASDMVKGRLEVRVRLVNVKSGKTIWPGDASAGYPLAVVTQHKHVPDSTAAADLEGQLCQTAADKISKLFYKHEIDETEVAEPQ